MENEIIYQSNFNNLPLSATVLSNLALSNGDPMNSIDSGDLRAYYTKEDLLSILQISNCVGIRFYNCNPTDDSPFIVAVGVNEEGFDIPESPHLFSNKASKPIEDNVTSLNRNRMQSSFFIKPSPIKAEQFASFFSVDMLDNLIKGDSLKGICFYQVAFNDIFTADKIPPNLKDRLTHLAITTNLDSDGNIMGVHASNGFNSKLSEWPCPGHCVNKDAGAESFKLDTEPFASSQFDTNHPYLVKW